MTMTCVYICVFPSHRDPVVSGPWIQQWPIIGNDFQKTRTRFFGMYGRSSVDSVAGQHRHYRYVLVQRIIAVLLLCNVLQLSILIISGHLERSVLRTQYGSTYIPTVRRRALLSVWSTVFCNVDPGKVGSYLL